VNAPAAPEGYVTELAVPEPVTVLQVLHSRMLTDPEPEPEAGL
jgi:hypothetical protein